MAARRSYPTSKASGGWEETPRVRDQGQPGETTSHLTPEARGGDLEEPPRAQGQGPRPGGATQVVVAVQAQEGLEEVSHVEGQEQRR